MTEVLGNRKVKIGIHAAIVGVLATGVAIPFLGAGCGESKDAVTQSDRGSKVTTSEIRHDLVAVPSEGSIAANHEAWSESWNGPRVMAMPLEAEPSDSGIHLAVNVAWCGHGDLSIDRVQVLKDQGEVVLTAYVALPAPERPGICPESLTSLTETLDLGEPVANRPIYDGLTWPPVKRWSK